MKMLALLQAFFYVIFLIKLQKILKSRIMGLFRLLMLHVVYFF